MEHLVTDIKELTSKKKLVYIDYEPAFALYAGEVRKFNLKTDTLIPESTYEEIGLCLSKRALARALHLFKDRDYTEYETRSKLSKSYYPEATVDYAVEYLKENHFIDDSRYAYNYICFRIDKLSRRTIENKLGQKGVSESDIRDAFIQFDEDNQENAADAEYSALVNLLTKRLKGQNPQDLSYEERQKLFAYMYRKGFAYDACRKALDELC